MALTLTDLPLDVLTVLSFHLPVEGVLTLMQTCRVMHALGSSDYLWHTLLSDWDVPLDIPRSVSLASLSSDSLRLAAVKSLRLDNRWRNPRREMRRAQCIIPRNSSFVDGMRFLPGGHCLVTFQYERPRTDVTLWTIADSNEHRPIFRLTIPGRVRCLHAHHDHNQVMIGIASVHRTADAIRVYSVSLRDDVSPRHALIFRATADELDAMGEVTDMKINDDIMFAVFVPLSSMSTRRAQIVCVNLVSRATVVLECPDWPLNFIACTRLKVFRQHFAVVASRFIPPRTATFISFHELPPVILDRLSSSVPRWPEKLTTRSLPIASTSWRSDSSSTYELSDDAPTQTTCSFTMFGYPLAEVGPGVIEITRVSFDGKNIECTLSATECRSTPTSEKIRVSSSGRRAVWLTVDDAEECTLERFAVGRGGVGSCSSTLMPSFSGLPFNPRDFHSFAFDELSCRMGVGLPTGELYILHFDFD